MVKLLWPNLKVPISRLLLVLLLVKRGCPSIKVPISSLLLLPEVWDVNLTLNSTSLLPGGRSYHCSGLAFSFEIKLSNNYNIINRIVKVEIIIQGT